VLLHPLSDRRKVTLRPNAQLNLSAKPDAQYAASLDAFGPHPAIDRFSTDSKFLCRLNRGVGLHAGRIRRYVLSYQAGAAGRLGSSPYGSRGNGHSLRVTV
jgi:hypothetical protein